MSHLSLVLLCVAVATAVPPSPIKKLSGRIVGGDIASPGQFPWQVAVYFDTPDGTYFCGGALISTSWVLTAGHCTAGATVFSLRLGTNSLAENTNTTLQYTVTRYVLHPDYDPNTLQNDIALIGFDFPILTNENVQTIPLATTSLAGDVPVVVSGWGATGDWDGAVWDLNFVSLTTLTNAQCRAIYGEATITDEMVCAVGPWNEGICSGDSGGALVAYDSAGYPTHVGVGSWASASGCETDHPSGYTRTASYISWINSVIA